MRMSERGILRCSRITVLALSASVSVFAAEQLDINAAAPADGQRVAPGLYVKVRIQNALIPEKSGTYRLDIKRQEHEIPMPDLKKKKKEVEDAVRIRNQTPGVSTDSCAPLAVAVAAVRTAQSEAEVESALATVTTRKRTVEGDDSCKAEVLDANIVKLETERNFQTYLQLEEGTFATATLYRNDKKVAEKTFDAGKLGSMFSTGLFGGLQNRDERWFTKATDKPGEFVVTEEANRRDLDPLVSLLIGWQPENNTTGFWNQLVAFKKNQLSGSFAAGLGSDTESLMVLGGYIVRVGRIGFATGLAGYNQDRLKGIYKGDGTDVVKENLTPNQLVDKTFSWGWWLGITMQL